MSKLMKGMAFVCSIYDMNFRNMAEEHGFDSGEALRGKVSLGFADSLYNERRDRNDEYVDYGVLGLKDIKYMARVLADIMKPGAHAHMSCSALHLFLR